MNTKQGPQKLLHKICDYVIRNSPTVYRVNKGISGISLGLMIIIAIMAYTPSVPPALLDAIYVIIYVISFIRPLLSFYSSI